ncbi:M18 family aminopeptidase [Mogibacterium pumilum]|uniref:M18 family aminopeptidase n=1 Tax=Mogibacterium pumilum TaxID=86332 RepID=A0A223ATW6_9FIRM|nr:M18 family aminopeptidase [Mogibacterium pumilum]ASS38413.1 M18 family aminopeptidase [Mogibacterium pumilum]
MTDYNKGLMSFLDESPTAFHAVASIKKKLVANGYSELAESEKWDLTEGGRYFVTRNDSSIIAFSVPHFNFTGFMISAAHSDSPAFKVKENPEIVENGYVKLNIEGYRGMLMASWLDRPLSVAGRVIVKSGNRYEVKLVNVDRDLLIIPNVAIHMNRDVNKNQTWNAQVDMLPILGSSDDTKGSFMRIVAEAAEVNEEEIISHDLFIYARDKGKVWGGSDEYISAPHLDDLQCVYGCLEGFLGAKPSSSVPVLAVFDNEETGSLSKQGADSTFLEDVLRRISLSCGKDEEGYYRSVSSSFMVSADNAHALHPNHPEKADPVNRPAINKGIVIKFNAAQHYTTDAVSCAVYRDMCESNDIPVQVFTNRSDSRGGSTLGNVSNAHVSINTVDIGLAQLAMHSCYETAGAKDTKHLACAMTIFYSKTFRTDKSGTFELVD